MGGQDPVLRWVDGLRQTLDYDCQQCGACCVGDPRGLPSFVVLTGGEAGTLGRLGLPVLRCEDGCHELGTISYQGGGAERVCAAFQGRVGGACGCGVYDDRPAACRRFEVGSHLCRVARQEAGLPL